MNDKDLVRKQLLVIMENNPMSVKYYAIQIGLTAPALTRFMYGESRAQFKTIAMISNFIKKFYGQDFFKEEKPAMKLVQAFDDAGVECTKFVALNEPEETPTKE